MIEMDDPKYQDEFCSIECKALNTKVMLLLRRIFKHLATLSTRLQNFVRTKYDIWDEEERKIYLVVYAILSLLFVSLLINYIGYSDNKLLCSLAIITLIPIWVLKGIGAVVKAILLCAVACFGLIIISAIYSFIVNVAIPIFFGIIGLILTMLEKLVSSSFFWLGAFLGFVIYHSAQSIIYAIEANRCCKKFHDD